MNSLLATTSLNLGFCWIGFTKYNFTSPEKYKRVGILEDYEVHYGNTSNITGSSSRITEVS
jgi:hypothetical protein